jgi:hypothetical protein
LLSIQQSYLEGSLLNDVYPVFGKYAEEAMKSLWPVLVAVLLASGCFAEIKDPDKTESGLVHGVTGKDANITAFKGIPYAEPPVGSLRWAEPKAPHLWMGYAMLTTSVMVVLFRAAISESGGIGAADSAERRKCCPSSEFHGF